MKLRPHPSRPRGATARSLSIAFGALMMAGGVSASLVGSAREGLARGASAAAQAFAACTPQDTSLCTPIRPACLDGGACGCTSSAQCPPAAPVCSAGTRTCVASCGADSDCPDPLQGHCDTAASPPACVTCLRDDQCADGGVCSAARTCVACAVGNAALCTGDKPVCLATGACGCTADTQCGALASARVCELDAAVCIYGCRGVGGLGCPAGLVCSSGDAAIGACVQRDGGADGGDGAIVDTAHVGGGGVSCRLAAPGVKGTPATLALPMLLVAGAGASRRGRRRRPPP